MPTAIRSFELHNNGVAIDIWPQLKDPNDPDNSDKNVWDGRFDTNESTKLNITQTKTFDLGLGANKISGKTFILAANVLFGTDKYDEKRTQFIYDPTSTKIACGRADGGVHDGNLVYTGIKEF